MGSLKLTLRLSTCSSLLLWSAAPLLLPLRLRPSQRPRLMLTTHMPMVLTHMLMVLMLMELTHTAMVTMGRDLLRLSQRLMLMLTTDTHMATDHMDTEPTDMDTPDMVTTERDPLMLSQKPRLMLLSCTEPTDMVPTDHTLMVPTEESGDKHLKSSVQIRSSKQTSI